MPVGDKAATELNKRSILLKDLRKYASGSAQVSDDVVAANGVVLLPKGTKLASLLSSADVLEKNLQQWGVVSIPITIENKFDARELEKLLKSAETNLMRVDPELAKNTVEQVEKVYDRIIEGNCTPEDISRLADQGRTLAKEVAAAPQVMLCLGRVRSWDEYTYVHSLNVALLGGFLASRLYPDQPEIAECMSVGGILHDLGKARIPISILNKPGPLTSEEFSVIRKHAEYGEALAIENGVTDRRVLAIIRGHHERYGGGGYPDALRKDQILLEAKIAAVADVFDALTARRVYKDPMESRVALSMMLEDRGTHFDPLVVRTLLLSIGLYPPGTTVELSDDSVGVVVGSRGRDLLRPHVLLQYDGTGREATEVQVVDLSLDGAPYIRRPIQDIGKVAF